MDALSSNWLTTGPKARMFEEKFAAYVSAEHALAVNSATAGLHLALESVGTVPGSRVATSPYTFTATAEVTRYLGADPVFVDIDPGSFNICPNALAETLQRDSSITSIIPVHFAGQMCDMNAIMQLAREFECHVIEDAAHALPASFEGRPVGTIGDLTVFSFYATKTIATGEGGMVTTANARWAERIRTMRLHGINRDVFDRYASNRPSWHYEVVAPGFKYNMTDLAAALGIEQLRKAELFHKRREWIAGRYDEAFSDLPLRTPRKVRPDDVHSWHLYVLQLCLEELDIDRNRFIELMSEQGVGTSVHFIPLHIQPYWRDRYGFQPDDFPVAMEVYQRAVSLPIYPAMSDDDVDRVIEAVRAVCSRYSK